jgi:cupin superfamily protein
MTSAALTSERLLLLDADDFRSRFGHEAFLVHHTLAGHPLLELESIAELADFLPSGLVEHNMGDQPEVLENPEEVERLDDTPGNIARGIETNGAWMVLKEIERHPDYARLLNESLDEVEEHVAGIEGPMRRRMGFMFLSAPGSVTPVHIDTEHNLLLQVRGTKQMSVGQFRDTQDFERELERLYSGGATRYLKQGPEEMTAFDLEPGIGICVPHSFPHVVRNGPTPSISLSITFQTPQSQRVADAYALNSRLRRMHVDPKPPEGGDALRDRVKAGTWRALRAPVRAARRLRG